MTFLHVPPIEIKDLDTTSINGKRFYLIPNGDKYPSITTVLSSRPNPFLIKWRKRVGDAVADEISRKASSRGSDLHLLCEKYLLNQQVKYNTTTGEAYELFKTIRPLLNRLNNIHALEIALFNSRLKVAGRCDCIGEFDGVLSIIDFKTSKKIKEKSDIPDYFIQAAFYALAYQELTGIMIKQIVIMMTIDDGEYRIFIEEVKNHIKPLLERIREYYKDTENE